MLDEQAGNRGLSLERELLVFQVQHKVVLNDRKEMKLARQLSQPGEKGRRKGGTRRRRKGGRGGGKGERESSCGEMFSLCRR